MQDCFSSSRRMLLKMASLEEIFPNELLGTRPTPEESDFYSNRRTGSAEY
ncbi:MAG: hypothetical protein IH596_02465 [Bacteroidales bacterium]|nr:hypothetical protein [Bacteroidales bacterium]